MSAFRGLPEPQMTELREGLVLLEHSDPGARRAGLSTNTFAVLKNGRALLVDVSFSLLLPFVRQLRTKGFTPAGLLITHRHVAGTGDSLRDIADEFRIPVLLHPIDAQHPQSRSARVSFENPMANPLLAEFEVEAVLFPGHTEGHIILYGSANGGILITGDAAMGTSSSQAKAGVETVIRPPMQLSVDDDELRKQWVSFNRPVASILPYHGTGYMDRTAADMSNIMSPLTSAKGTTGFA
jgi:glyoxylase-like metal-dependent hydrolase (beta-lactamase superfamily II)